MSETDYVFGSSLTLDSTTIVSNIDITTNSMVPYVSYINNIKSYILDGLKMAYYDSAKGDWEVEIIPVSSNVQPDKTSIEYNAATAAWGEIAVAYKGAAYYEGVYLKPEKP